MSNFDFVLAESYVLANNLVIIIKLLLKLILHIIPVLNINLKNEYY